MMKDIDPEMMELISVLGSAINPRHQRRYKVNYHSPYYSRNRYIKV